jgi:hypothetical protein
MNAPDWLVKKARNDISRITGVDYVTAEEAARAVLDLVGPGRLVWRAHTVGRFVKETTWYTDGFEIERKEDEFVAHDISGSLRVDLSRHPTLEAAQAAAQAHADEAWWEQTNAAKERDNG